MTPSWLSGAMFPDGDDQILTIEHEPIGAGLIGSTSQVRYTTASGIDATVVAKLSSPDESVTAGAMALGMYEREIGFYLHAAPRCRMRVPHCHYAQLDTGTGASTLILEHVTDARPGDQIEGTDPEVAEVCVKELAYLHATWWEDTWMERQPWLAHRDHGWAQPKLDAFTAGAAEIRDRYGDALTSEQFEVIDSFANEMSTFYRANEDRPCTLVHHDYRPDNLLYSNDGGVVAVDFQTVSWAPACTDLAYFIQSGLTIENRRLHERRLVEIYHTALSEDIDGYDLQTCWDEYRRQVVAPIAILLLAVLAAERTERGDRMMQQWAQRLTTAAIDLRPGN